MQARDDDSAEALAAGEVTRGLAALGRGEPQALERLVPLLYDDLRRLARQRLRHERGGHTLDTTALVHEAYLRLSRHHGLGSGDRGSFFAAASNTMRRILVDYARARTSAKRGAGHQALSLDDAELLLSERAVEETLLLDHALAELERSVPRAAKVFEQRIFGGLTLDEIAAGMDLSTKTVQRDWDAARAWLRHQVGVAAGRAGREGRLSNDDLPA